MDRERYREVWIEKYKDDPDKDPDKTVDFEDIAQYDSDDNVYDMPTAAYREDLAKHKMVWTGWFWRDMWFYIKQEHTLLSICMSQKVHPYGRWERFFIELFIFALAVVWSASVTLAVIKGALKNQYVYYAAYYSYSILGGLVKTVVGILLKAAATCTCYQQDSTRARVKHELAGYVCMAIWGVISAGLFGLGIWFVYKGSNLGYNSWGAWIISLIISYVAGWVISLLITVVLYLLGYAACMKYDYKFGFDITYQDYLNWYDVYGELSKRGTFVESGSRHEQNGKYEPVAQNEMPTQVDTYSM